MFMSSQVNLVAAHPIRTQKFGRKIEKDTPKKEEQAKLLRQLLYLQREENNPHLIVANLPCDFAGCGRDSVFSL